MEEKKNINMSINEGDSFYAHELSVNFNPMQFILDFKNITPRIDARSQEGMVINLKHNVIMIDPYHAKEISKLLGQMLERYEKEFGKIEKPKALSKAEKKGSKNKDVDDSPTYFG
jgi:hypothetical protein